MPIVGLRATAPPLRGVTSGRAPVQLVNAMNPEDGSGRSGDGRRRHAVQRGGVGSHRVFARALLTPSRRPLRPPRTPEVVKGVVDGDLSTSEALSMCAGAISAGAIRTASTLSLAFAADPPPLFSCLTTPTPNSSASSMALSIAASATRKPEHRCASQRCTALNGDGRTFQRRPGTVPGCPPSLRPQPSASSMPNA